MIRFRRMNDGSVVYPREVPTGPPGYTQDPQDKCRWFPRFLRNCEHRYLGEKILPACNCKVNVLSCRLLQIPVNVPVCNDCKLQDATMEPIVNYDEQFPREIWIFGKGPSFDGFDFSTAGQFRIGINDAVYHIPDVFVACGTDQHILQMYSNGLPNSVRYTMLPNTCGMYFNRPVIRWDSDAGLNTGPAAIQTAIRRGTRILNLVGFDSLFGDWRYAKSITTSHNAGLSKSVYELSITQTRQILAGFTGKVNFAGYGNSLP